MLAKIILIRKRYPRMGNRKLQYLLQTNYALTIGRDNLYELLREKGLSIPKKRKRPVNPV